MPDSTTSETAPTPTPRAKRRRLPRFGLRALFVIAVLFCLCMGWIGRNLYRIRQEEAAIETLKRAGASISVKTERGQDRHPATPHLDMYAADWSELPSLPARALGIADDYPMTDVDLYGGPDDPPQQKALEALATFPELEGIGLYGPAFDDESLPPLAKLPKLKGVLLSRTSITGNGLASLSQAPALAHLTLGEVADDSTIVAGLASLPQLESVQLYWQKVSREDVEVLASLPRLEWLNLTHVTLEGEDVFESLRQARSVRTFRLSVDPASGPIREADLKAIAALPRVERLFFVDVDGSHLHALSSVETLRHVELLHPRKADGAVIEFSAARPEALIERVETEGPTYFLNGRQIQRPAAEEFLRRLDER